MFEVYYEKDKQKAKNWKQEVEGILSLMTSQPL